MKKIFVITILSLLFFVMRVEAIVEAPVDITAMGIEEVQSSLEKGYFTTKTDSVTSQIKSMNTRIERVNQRLSQYEIRITKQFNDMDKTISNLNSQLSTFQSYI